MGTDLAAANVNRSYSLAATTIAIFTFSMIFLYPRYVSGEADPLLFQAVLVIMGSATFSFLVASFLYYGASLPDHMQEADRARDSGRADRLWLLGAALLSLDPSVILFAIGLYLPGAIWLVLWLGYLVFAFRSFPRLRR